MKKKLNLLLLACCCSLAANAQTDNFKKLDSFFDALATNNKAMGSIVIRQNGQTVYSKATGFRGYKAGEKIPSTPATIYRLGSISKVYTAAIIFQLIQQGRLTMETALSKYYPAIPNAADIKIKHLLNHSSGIFNITTDSTYTNWYKTGLSKNEMLKKMAGHPAVFIPGTSTRYSNSNFILLGYIIEDISKKTYQQNLDELINKKTGASHTYYFSKTDAAKNEAYSYAYENNQWEEQPETHQSIPHGAGAIAATAEETALFMEQYISGNILSRQWTDTVITGVKQLGYGVMKFTFDTLTGYGHNGAIDEFRSTAFYLPGQKIAMAFLSNGINYQLNDIMSAATKIYLQQPFTIPTFAAIELKDADLAKFNGVYSTDKFPLKITIDHKEGKLLAQATGQMQFSLDAQSPTSFANEQFGVVLEFVLTNGDTVKEMILKQGGAAVSFTK
jgi:D-alanyl-D-alanine carboxypeptidase